MPLTPGTRLGPYTIESLIGSGAMGEVYKAHDERLSRNLAYVSCEALFGETRGLCNISLVELNAAWMPVASPRQLMPRRTQYIDSLAWTVTRAQWSTQELPRG
jgi:hypothetical protein